MAQMDGVGRLVGLLLWELLVVRRSVVVDVHRKAAFDAVVRAVVEFDRAVARRDVACRGRDVAVLRAEKGLKTALGGMPLARWRKLADGRGQVRSARRGRELHLARARRDAVEAAVENLVRVKAAEQAKIVEAERELAGATQRLLVFGPAASTLSGRRLGELHRFSRAGRRPPSLPGS